jgi:hypothetical protein
MDINLMLSLTSQVNVFTSVHAISKRRSFESRLLLRAVTVFAIITGYANILVLDQKFKVFGLKVEKYDIPCNLFGSSSAPFDKK